MSLRTPGQVPPAMGGARPVRTENKFALHRTLLFLLLPPSPPRYLYKVTAKIRTQMRRCPRRQNFTFKIGPQLQKSTSKTTQHYEGARANDRTTIKRSMEEPTGKPYARTYIIPTTAGTHDYASFYNNNFRVPQGRPGHLLYWYDTNYLKQFNRRLGVSFFLRFLDINKEYKCLTGGGDYFKIHGVYVCRRVGKWLEATRLRRGTDTVQILNNLVVSNNYNTTTELGLAARHCTSDENRQDTLVELRIMTCVAADRRLFGNWARATQGWTEVQQKYRHWVLGDDYPIPLNDEIIRENGTERSHQTYEHLHQRDTAAACFRYCRTPDPGQYVAGCSDPPPSSTSSPGPAFGVWEPMGCVHARICTNKPP